jgi:hypothetical protein
VGIALTTGNVIALNTYIKKKILGWGHVSKKKNFISTLKNYEKKH